MEQQIGVVGYECEDVTIYLARIFTALGKRTAIIDRSEQEMLCEMLGADRKDEEGAKEREYGGIWITNRNVCAEQFDVVFCVFGYRLEHPKLHECEAVLKVTDGVPAHASLLRRSYGKECNSYLIIRNLVPMKHTAEYLAGLAGNKEQYGVVLYEEKDIRVRCGLNGYGVIGIRHLSAGMKKELRELMKFFACNYSQKEIREAMKKI